MTDDITGTDWSDREIDLIVADYFQMLRHDLARRPYVKAAHNESLRKLTRRSRGSIERKHQNISAVLVRLGLPWINGYKPLANFQNTLIDGIGRYLVSKGDVLEALPVPPVAVLSDPPSLWIGPPPTLAVEDTVETPALRRLIRQFDPAERDARNRALGKRGEELVFEHERQRLRLEGRDDLAHKVEWTSHVRGDGAGYDIHSFKADGSDRLIEVKTTNGAALTPFFLSENERAFSEERPDAFRLLRLYSFIERPSAFELSPPLHHRLTLSPESYRATLSIRGVV